MKCKYSFLLVTQLVLMAGCNQQKKTEDMPSSSTPINNKDYINTLLEQSLNGDSIAYSELMGYYLLEHRYHEIMYQSLIIANKYSNANAYFLIYWSYIHPNYYTTKAPKEQLVELDNKTRLTTLYNLLKARELGNPDAKYIALDIFGDSTKIPSARTYLDSFSNAK
jgi:hypothetical protein